MFRRLRPRGIRAQLVLLVLLSVTPFLVLITLVASDHLRRQEPLARQDAVDRAEIAATRLDARLLTVNSMLVVLAHAIQADPGDRARNDLLVRDIESEMPPRFAKLYAFAANGRQIAGEAVVARDWATTIAAARASPPRRLPDVVVSGPVRGRVANEPAIRFLRLPAEQSGVLAAAEVPAHALEASLSTRGMPPGTRITVISKSGIVVASSHPDTPPGRDVSAIPAIRRMLEVGTASGTGTGVSGDDRVGAVFPTQHAPWFVGVGVPYSAVAGVAWWGMIRALLWGALALAVAVGLALHQSHRLIRPLRALARHARSLGTGDVSRAPLVEREDELGALGRTMDHMVVAIQEREEAARASEQRYRALFDANPAPMFVFDTTDLRFLAANEATLDKYGYTEEEFLAMTAVQIRPKQEVGDFLNYLEQSRGRTVRGMVRAHQKKDGTVFYVEIDSTEITFDGRPAQIAIATDVTQRLEAQRALKDTEDRLRQAEKMEAVGQLTGGIAHDFNNVLTAIRSYSEFLLGALPEGDERRADVQEILKAQERAAALTKQLLAFSRSQILQPRVMDLSDAVEEMETLIRRVTSENMTLEILPSPGNCVRADPAQITQILLNLAVNARDAMAEGGKLTIAVGRRELDQAVTAEDDSHVLGPGSYVTLEATDTGSGITPEVRRRIFDPFFTTKPPGKGTGMGLATVYGIVKQSGGHIYVESAPGEGTKFTILLPRVGSDPEPRRTPRAVTRYSEGSGATILVVEDEPAVRQAVKRMLADQGYTIFDAGNGQEALEIAEHHPDTIDLVLTDLVMPGMDGRELVQALEARRAGIRALYMSGYTKDAAVRDGIDRDIAVIEKPFTRADLLGRVRESLGLE